MQKINTSHISDDLSKKVVKGSFWLILFQIFDNILGFLRLIILARILAPNDFGLVGVAWLILQIINTFTTTGIQQAMIHKPKIDKYLNTAWTYLLIRGIVLYCILYILAPILGNFFNAVSAIQVIRAIGLTLIIEGFMNIGVIFFQKHLAFNKQFIYQISGSIVDFVVAIGLALILHNVWAIIYGSLANGFIRLILSYILSGYRPKIEFKIDIFKELNSYGKWIGGSNILQFLYSQGDDMLVSKIFGTTSLGFYQLAYRISNLPTTQITWLISSVMFPAYSKIQSDRERVANIYLSVLLLIAFLSFFVGAIIICFAHDFTVLFLGSKWLPIVLPMQILTIWGIIRSLGATTGPVWQALGTPKTNTKLQFLMVLILAIIIYPLTILWNISGTSLAVVISALIPNIIAVYLIHKTLFFKLKDVIIEILFPLIACSIMIGLYIIFKIYIIKDTTILAFIMLTFMCLVSYLFITIFFSKLLNYKVYKNLFILAKSVNKTEKYNKYIIKLELFF